MDPVISVIIPTRDRAGLLADAVAAVRGQSYPHVELIVVDDGSADSTPDLLAGMERDGRVDRSLRHEAPLGAGAARNAGADAARGELLLFEDDDCRGAPDRLEKLARALAAAPDAAYAFCRSRRLDSAGRTMTKGHEGPWSIGTPAALIRADAFREVGGFDPELPRLQDFDLWTRLLARASAVDVPEVLFEAGWDDQGISASDQRLLAAEAHLLAKYRASRMPGPHLAAMHRRLGGKLLVNGFWKRGLVHLSRAIRRCWRCPRSWAAFAAGLAGPAIYRAVVAAVSPPDGPADADGGERP